MKSKKALKELQKYLARAGDDIPRTPRVGMQLMCSFYKEVRCEDVELDHDGDMLLFQWGTYDRGKGKHFEVDITRQLIRGGGDDEDIWQLHLTYYFLPSDELSGLGAGDRWCKTPGQLAAFEVFIQQHPAMELQGAKSDGRVELGYECAG